MGNLGLSAFDRTIHETNIWLSEIAEEIGRPDKQMAYHAMRGTLFALRDRLMPDQALDLAAQLPTLVRGIFFDGYDQVGNRPMKYDRNGFLSRVRKELDMVGGENAERAARAVLDVLSRHVSEGAVDKVVATLPIEMRDLWKRPE